jgi:hypothetical protein
LFSYAKNPNPNPNPYSSTLTLNSIGKSVQAVETMVMDAIAAAEMEGRKALASL